MAGGSTKSTNPPRTRKRVEADTAQTSSLKRARDGSAFTRCEACNSNVAVALIDMHDCGLDSKIRMNLEAQVVEKTTEIKSPPARKRATASANKEGKGRKEKSKDPNAPKRPPTAFFVFMDEFRKEYKAANPDSKGVSEVAKEGGRKWKSMSEEDKKQYIDKAAELKAEYEEAINKNKDEDNGEEKDASEKEEEEKKDASEKEEE